MKLPTLPLLLRAGPLAALPLFAGFSPPLTQSAPSAQKLDTALTIHLDIRPADCPNSVDVNSFVESTEFIDGAMVSVLTMAILGNKFEVDQVDVGSVGLSRSEISDEDVIIYPIGFLYADVATPFEGEECECDDAGDDGIEDLLLKFNKHQLVEAFALHEYPHGSFLEMKVSGLLIGDGHSEFVGRDCIRIVNEP